MHQPEVSIVMPAYNAAPYLKLAIESLLGQTFGDFELIVIDDGSTDDTVHILETYSDERLVIVKNDSNKGLTYSLNKGIQMAKGKYLARMDADDIALPRWLEEQLTFLEENPSADLVVSRVSLIDENGASLPPWKEDQQNLSEKEIREFMPKNNCVAHPGMVTRTPLIKTFGYNPRQSQAEDYDLWLRILARGYRIHKNTEALIQHRILTKSFTRSQEKNVYFKLAKTKFRFCLHQLAITQMNLFSFRVFLFALGDSILGFGKAIKMKFKR